VAVQALGEIADPDTVSDLVDALQDDDWAVRCVRTARIGIGGSLTAPPLPHHRTCGSASGGSAG
jgi:HEAT repeat protein